MAKERIWNKSLDIIKTVAIITVLMTHISASFVILFPVSSPEFIWGNIIDSLSRIGVPLFVMVSGALFLDEDLRCQIILQETPVEDGRTLGNLVDCLRDIL